MLKHVTAAVLLWPCSVRACNYVNNSWNNPTGSRQHQQHRWHASKSLRLQKGCRQTQSAAYLCSNSSLQLTLNTTNDPVDQVSCMQLPTGALSTCPCVAVQLLVAPIRPATHARALSSWNFWHHIWGRLTLLAGFANIIIGACLVHDLKSAPYKNWLLPACVVLGVMLLVALCLEAFKMQVCVVSSAFSQSSGAG